MSLFGAAFGRQIHSFAQAYPGARDCTTALPRPTPARGTAPPPP